jgi:hypothetical protein
MFRVSATPKIRGTKNVITASGTGHSICMATSLQHGRWPHWSEVAVLEAVNTVLCTPDDGCC